MPSHLRLQSSLEAPIAAQATYHTLPTARPAKKAKMSLKTVYLTASTARSKLGREASLADHNLRRLVGHANLLDSLMIELADAEREQEAWFNQSVSNASKSEPRHVTWVDQTIEEDDAEYESDSDDEMDEEEQGYFSIMPTKIREAPVTLSSDDFEDLDSSEDLKLTRVASHQSPPELTHEDQDSESDSEDELPSPEQVSLRRLSAKEEAFYHQQQQQTPMIAAC